MKEVWVEIEGYPNYAVSNYGRVVNLTREVYLKPRPNEDGHLRVSLSYQGHVRDFYIRRLVAKAFIPDYDPREQIIHWDDDKENNMLTNLRIRKRERSSNSFVLGRRQTGRRVKIVETNEIFRTARDCARHIGGDYGSVYACLRGDRKTHRGYTFEYHDW